MKRVLVTLIFATLAGALVFGAAASLEVGAANLGSGSSVVAACDTADDDSDNRDADGDGTVDHIEVDYSLVTGDPTKVESIVVSDISANCDGQTVYLGVFDGSSGDLFVGTDFQVYTHATDAGSLTFTPSSQMDSSAVEAVAVTITGDAPAAP